MREIRFRAYIPPEDGEPGIMRDIIRIDWIDGEIEEIETEIEYHVFYRGNGLESVTIMGYIGRKDNAGIWICGGDIITVDMNFCDITVYVVMFDCYGCGFKLFYPRDYHSQDNAVDILDATPSICIEIIGNIYENPELLNES